MKILILTSSSMGTASTVTPILAKAPGIEIVQVVLNEAKKRDKGKFLNRKLKKITNIGVLGTLNGMRIRKWYSKDTHTFLDAKPIENVCSNLSINFSRTPTINCKNTAELFKQSGADIGISLGNSYIAKQIFTIPKYGMLNIHHELLPQYRGAQSIIWQIYNMSGETGYTIHKISKNIDDGAILLRKKIPIEFKETLRKTVYLNYAKLIKEGGNDMADILQNFCADSQNEVPKSEKNKRLYTTPTIKEFWTIRKNFQKLKMSHINACTD